MAVAEKVSFEGLIKEAPSYSQKEAKEFADTYCVSSIFGISISAFAALVCKGTIPSFAKVPEELLYDVQLASFKKAFAIRPEVIRDMPAGIIEVLINEDCNFISKAYSSSYSRGTYNDRWIGDQVLHLIPREEFASEDVEFIQEDLLKRLEQNSQHYKVELTKVPTFLITDEMYILWMGIYGENLQYVPEDRRTLEICKAAVNKSGAALLYVPEEFRKDFYMDAVRSGKGLSSIPELDITESMCAIAVETNVKEFRYVPEELKSYLLCLQAIDKDAELIKEVPTKHIDQEMITRLIISILHGRWEHDFCLNDVASYMSERGQKEPVLTTVFDNFFNTQEESIERKEQMRELSKEIVKREPTLYFRLLDFSGENDENQGHFRFNAGNWRKYFENSVRFEHAIIAAQNDITVVSGFKADLQERIWKHYLQTMNK